MQSHMDNGKIFLQLTSNSRGLLSVSDSNNAETKKKTVRNCDIINIKIKPITLAGIHRSVNEIAGPLRLGIGQLCAWALSNTAR